MNVSTTDLRWLVAALVVKLPWSSRRWALPFLAVLLCTPKVSAKLSLRHKKLTFRTMQLIKWLRHTCPDRPIKLIGDDAYSVIDLGKFSAKHKVSLIAPICLDARLFSEPPPRSKHIIGRPRRVGQRLPYLRDLAVDEAQSWERIELEWYGGTKRAMALLSGTGLW